MKRIIAILSTQLNRLMALMVLCALMALPGQAQDGEFELEEGYYIADGMLTILIKEGNDELVECLRWAANQDKVEIGECTQITGLTISGQPIAESWDRNAAFTGLTHIGTFMLFEHAPELRRYFKLFFSAFSRSPYSVQDIHVLCVFTLRRVCSVYRASSYPAGGEAKCNF